jgi:hypothetical protein
MLIPGENGYGPTHCDGDLHSGVLLCGDDLVSEFD